MYPYAVAMTALGVLGLAVLLPHGSGAPGALLAVVVAAPLALTAVGRIGGARSWEAAGGLVFLAWAVAVLPRAWGQPSLETTVGTVAALPGIVAAISAIRTARRAPARSEGLLRLGVGAFGAGIAVAAGVALLAGGTPWTLLLTAMLVGVGFTLVVAGTAPRGDRLLLAAGLLPVAAGLLAVPWTAPALPVAVRVAVSLAGCLLVPWAAWEAVRRVLGMLPPYRYVLVREGLLEQTLVADAVYPWHRILAFDLGDVEGRPVVVLHLLYGPEPDPPFELVGSRQPAGLAAWTSRRVRGYQRTRAWTGTDLLVGPRGLEQPAPELYRRMRQIAMDPAQAAALPLAADVVGEVTGPG